VFVCERDRERERERETDRQTDRTRERERGRNLFILIDELSENLGRQPRHLLPGTKPGTGTQ